MSDQRSDGSGDGPRDVPDGPTPANPWANPGTPAHGGPSGTPGTPGGGPAGWGAQPSGTPAYPQAPAPWQGGAGSGPYQAPQYQVPQNQSAQYQTPPYQGNQYQGNQYQAPPKPGVIPLRPLGLGEILDGAFQACRKNPIATFGNAILLQAVVTLVTILALGNVLSSFEVLDSQSASFGDFVGAVASFSVFAAVAGILSGVALLVLQGILVIPIARAVINQKTTFGQSWRLARGRLLPLLAFGVLAFLAGLVGFGLVIGLSALAVYALEEYSAFLIVPLVLGAVAALVWVSTKLVVTPAALMLEQRGPLAAVRRSWVLTRGNWWRTFGIVLLTALIVSIIGSVISAPLTFAVTLIFGFSTSTSATPDALDSLPLLAATQAITALFTAIGYAFQSGVTSLLYVDLRMRREGFDVVLMKEHEQAQAGRPDVLPGGTSSFGHGTGGPR